MGLWALSQGRGAQKPRVSLGPVGHTHPQLHSCPEKPSYSVDVCRVHSLQDAHTFSPRAALKQLSPLCSCRVILVTQLQSFAFAHAKFLLGHHFGLAQIDYLKLLLVFYQFQHTCQAEQGHTESMACH